MNSKEPVTLREESFPKNLILACFEIEFSNMMKIDPEHFPCCWETSALIYF